MRCLWSCKIVLLFAISITASSEVLKPISDTLVGLSRLVSLSNLREGREEAVYGLDGIFLETDESMDAFLLCISSNDFGMRDEERREAV